MSPVRVIRNQKGIWKRKLNSSFPIKEPKDQHVVEEGQHPTAIFLEGLRRAFIDGTTDGGRVKIAEKYIPDVDDKILEDFSLQDGQKVTMYGHTFEGLSTESYNKQRRK